MKEEGGMVDWYEERKYETEENGQIEINLLCCFV